MAGRLTTKRAPPSARLATSIRPPWRSTIQAAMASPRPGAAARRARAPGRTARTRAAGPRAGCPGPSSSTTSEAPLPTGPDGHPDPAVGRAVADRVVDQDHDQLAEPGRVAGHDRRLRVDLDPDAPVGRGLAHRRRAVGGDVAEVDRHVLELDGARVGAGQQQQVLDDRGHVADLVVDVLERGADRRRPARRGGAARCSTLLRMTVSGVRSSWLASAANSRWRRSAVRWLASDSRIGTSARRA